MLCLWHADILSMLLYVVSYVLKCVVVHDYDRHVEGGAIQAAMLSCFRIRRKSSNMLSSILQLLHKLILAARVCRKVARFPHV
jgi:hypothetical protein